MKRPKLPNFTYDAIPLDPDDLIRVQAVSSTTPCELSIEGTALNLDGTLSPFLFILNVTSAVTLTVNQFRLGYQALLSIAVHSRTSGIPDGSCFCQVTLVQSQSGGVYPLRKILASGYVSTLAGIGYGSSHIQGAPTDHCFLQNIPASDPAAGAEWEYVLPDYTILEVIDIMFTLVTSATVANRIPNIEVTLPGANNHNYITFDSHPASSTKTYTFFPACTDSNPVNPGRRYGYSPFLWLQSGCTLSSNTTALQAGDQYSDVSLLVRRRTLPFSS